MSAHRGRQVIQNIQTVEGLRMLMQEFTPLQLDVRLPHAVAAEGLILGGKWLGQREHLMPQLWNLEQLRGGFEAEARRCVCWNQPVTYRFAVGNPQQPIA